MSPEEKKKLYDAIGYAGDDTSTITYPDEVCSSFYYRDIHLISFSMLILI
jgi:hypothetical protein